MNLNEIHPMQKATELRLLAAAIELQHLTGMAANMVPIPGGDRVIAVGAPAEVARLLEVTPTAQPVAVSAGIEGLTRYRESSTGMVTAPSGKYYMAADVERLLATQSAKQGAQPSTLDRICDLFGIGALARSESTILENVRNAIRREECLTAVERTFFMAPAEPDEDFPDEDPGDECLLGWGRTPEQYVKQFRAALKKIGVAPAAPLQTMDDTTRDEALEEAAQACESEIVENSGLREQEDHNYAVSTCAKLIRAMKSSPASTDGDQKGRKS